MSESQPTAGGPSGGTAGGTAGDPGGGHAVGRRAGAGGRTPAQGDELQPLAVSSARVVVWGSLGWVLALAVILAVPALHQGERDWWPWVPVAGIVLGLIGYSYVRRGRGNAAGAK